MLSSTFASMYELVVLQKSWGEVQGYDRDMVAQALVLQSVLALQGQVSGLRDVHLCVTAPHVCFISNCTYLACAVQVSYKTST